MPRRSKLTVIVIDDDSSVRRALRMQLRLAGFNVRTFDSAENLLAGKFPTDNACLLLDIYMPGITGLELCDILMETGRQLPAILMSGREGEETRRLVRRAKGVPCLFKPFDQATLLRAIRKVTAGDSKAGCQPGARSASQSR